MRELSILTFLTLDGVMQAPRLPAEDPSGGFERGGWATPYWDDVMTQVRREAMSTPYDLLLGRRTYDLFAAHNANADDPEAARMNDATKFVATSNPDTLGWRNSTALTADIAAQIARLKQQDGPLLQVHGSWQLIQTLLAHDLVDHFRLWTFPVVVGAGKRLFEPGAAPRALTLVKSERTSAAGVVMNLYRRVPT